MHAEAEQGRHGRRDHNQVSVVPLCLSHCIVFRIAKLERGGGVQCSFADVVSLGSEESGRHSASAINCAAECAPSHSHLYSGLLLLSGSRQTDVALNFAILNSETHFVRSFV